MSNNLEESQDNCVMNLKQIVDFINQKRGVVKGVKGYIPHARAKTIIENLVSEVPSFGRYFESTLENNGQQLKENT